METNSDQRQHFLKVSKLQSIKTKIIVFALLATIAPTIVLGVMSYVQNSSLLREKISQELRNATDQSAKELDLWLKERLYDLKVFSSSYIISENIDKATNANRSSIKAIVTLDQLKGYLQSVSEKFGVYEKLFLLNLSGDLIGTSSETSSGFDIPKTWTHQLKSSPKVGLKPSFVPYILSGSILIGEGITSSSGMLLGVLVAEIDLNAVRDMLKQRCVDGIDEIYLIDEQRKLLVSSTPHEKAATKQIIIDHAQVASSQIPTDYVDRNDREVIGTAKPIAAMEWMMIAEMDKENAYAEIVKLRLITTTLVGGLIFCIGLCAYIFGHSLVSPLRRLSRGAARVAGGDLAVDIPVTGLSEVSYLTQVFNHMVSRLKKGREEISEAHQSLIETNEILHQISITDSLTGLHNRKHIMDLLGHEMAKAIRYGHALSVLMLDIDYFKNINDTFGHQVGDSVMHQLAGALKESVRECDYVGRYGGEEFLILLPNSTMQDSAALAERIRQTTGRLQIHAGGSRISVTISIGVSGYPEGGSDTESIIRRADDALYQAKSRGRDCVVMSDAAGDPAPSGEEQGTKEAAPNLKLVSRS